MMENTGPVETQERNSKEIVSGSEMTEKPIFQGIAIFLDKLVALSEQIPNKNLEEAMSVKTKGHTLVIIRKRELEEIKKDLQDLANLLSKPVA